MLLLEIVLLLQTVFYMLMGIYYMRQTRKIRRMLRSTAHGRGATERVQRFSRNTWRTGATHPTPHPPCPTRRGHPRARFPPASQASASSSRHRCCWPTWWRTGSHMVHFHTVHLPLGAHHC